MKQWDLRGVTVNVAEPDIGEKVLVEATDSLRVLVDQFPALFWTTDMELRITASLGAELVTLGLGPNQMVGTTLLELFETEDAAYEPTMAHKRALNGEAVTFELHWAGKHFHCQVGPLQDSTGELIGTVCVGLDDSRMEERLNPRRLAAAT